LFSKITVLLAAAAVVFAGPAGGAIAVQPLDDIPVVIASDGWRLAGDFAHADAGVDRQAAVLLLHGAARDRRAYIALARELASRGVSSLRLDLRGEGESTNLGRFVPGRTNPLLAGAERDIVAGLAWLRARPGINPGRIGVLGASYTGELMAAAARAGSTAASYVALSPGDFSDESMQAIDPSGVPWWFIGSHDERFAPRSSRRVERGDRRLVCGDVDRPSRTGAVGRPGTGGVGCGISTHRRRRTPGRRVVPDARRL
jgi:dienelactone hydrolase